MSESPSPSTRRFVEHALLASLALSGCARLTSGLPAASTVAAAPTLGAPAPSQSPSGSLAVAYIEDGNLLVWNQASGETRTLFDSGDVIRVEPSDDGRVLAFLRRSVVQRSETEAYEQSALWAIDSSGENTRELVSADGLRSLLAASETDSTNFPDLRWVPGTHRLLFSGWTYLVQAEGESHAVPRGLYLVDAEAPTPTVVVPADNNIRFAPSPDGKSVALMSPTGLSFVGVDGTDFRQDVLTYSPVGMPGPLFPTGVWTEDSSAFVLTGSLEEDPAAGITFALWRVPVDGSAPRQLATIERSHPGSVTFSPDGKFAGHIQYTDTVPVEIAGWSITPLGDGAGPLAVPRDIEIGYAGLHWSPDGRAYTAELAELCPGATQDKEICKSPISDGESAAIQWLDPTHVLLLTRDPSALFLVTLDPSAATDATSVPIHAWPLEEAVGPESFAAVGEGA
ncbi:MAG TPA: hypothetical protein VK449_12700 [Anaerolineales bacterium]|nr:hypothetical protein [Anaerolineales bacterium]